MWSGHRGGMVSWETSAAEGEQDSLGLWEEKPQGPESNQAEPPSQESSSGYVEETVAGIAQLKLGTPPHEMESPMAQVLRTRHLLAMPSTSAPENLQGTDLAVVQYKPHSSIQMFQEQAALVNIGCQGTSETGNVSRPSAHGTPTDLQNRRSRGRVPAECLEQKMLYVYTTVCTQGDFTLSRK